MWHVEAIVSAFLDQEQALVRNSEIFTNNRLKLYYGGKLWPRLEPDSDLFILIEAGCKNAQHSGPYLPSVSPRVYMGQGDMASAHYL